MEDTTNKSYENMDAKIKIFLSNLSDAYAKSITEVIDKYKPSTTVEEFMTMVMNVLASFSAGVLVSSSKELIKETNRHEAALHFAGFVNNNILKRINFSLTNPSTTDAVIIQPKEEQNA